MNISDTSESARTEKRPPWWSPPDQPAWARPVLLLIAAAAALTYAWGLEHVLVHDYYAPAVRSMAQSWRAFSYGGFDPEASITLDKLPGALMLQALSVRLFGFHSWSLVLPQALAAVVAVLVLYSTVRRWLAPVPPAGESAPAGDSPRSGRAAVAGLLGAALLATTPILAALARSQIPDVLMVMLLVLAADACLRAVHTGRWPAVLRRLGRPADAADRGAAGLPAGQLGRGAVPGRGRGRLRAGPLVMAGASALPLGGYSSVTPFPTADQLADLIARRDVRFVLLGGIGSAIRGNSRTELQAWVVGHCRPVTQPAVVEAAGATFQRLYDCYSAT